MRSLTLKLPYSVLAEDKVGLPLVYYQSNRTTLLAAQRFRSSNSVAELDQDHTAVLEHHLRMRAVTTTLQSPTRQTRFVNAS